jgi:hypothetical protein
MILSSDSGVRRGHIVIGLISEVVDVEEGGIDGGGTIIVAGGTVGDRGRLGHQQMRSVRVEQPSREGARAGGSRLERNRSTAGRKTDLRLGEKEN